MIDALAPYPEYRDSGFPSLPVLPSTWSARRAKFLLREMDSRTTTGTEPLLSVSQYTGVTQRKFGAGTTDRPTRASSLIGYKRVRSNELVINIMLAWNGSLGISRQDGIVSPAYCVYKLSSVFSPWYSHYLLRSDLYKSLIRAASTGVVDSRLRLYTDALGRLELPLPPSPNKPPSSASLTGQPGAWTVPSGRSGALWPSSPNRSRPSSTAR